jgi:hypothetical protein
VITVNLELYKYRPCTLSYGPGQPISFWLRTYLHNHYLNFLTIYFKIFDQKKHNLQFHDELLHYNMKVHFSIILNLMIFHEFESHEFSMNFNHLIFE